MLTQRLRQIRKEHGYSQQNIADILGIDRTTYTYYEIGTTSPSIYTLKKLSAVYGVTIDYLAGGEEEKGEANESSESDCAEVMVAENKETVKTLSKQEKMLVGFYRLLDETAKEELLKTVENFVKMNN